MKKNKYHLYLLVTVVDVEDGGTAREVVFERLGAPNKFTKKYSSTNIGKLQLLQHL